MVWLCARWSLGAKIRALGHCVFMSSKLPLLNACIEKTINPERPGLQVQSCLGDAWTAGGWWRTAVGVDVNYCWSCVNCCLVVGGGGHLALFELGIDRLL